MRAIPPDQDYQEYCKECDDFYIPHWTYCKCPRVKRKLDIAEVIKEVEKELKLCEKDQYHVGNDSVEIYCPEKGRVLTKEDEKPVEKEPETVKEEPKPAFKIPEKRSRVDKIMDELSARWHQ